MIPHIALVGKSGSGKTTLIIKLVEYFTKAGYRVGTIKHTHHEIEFDREGKDSYRQFHAGAVSSLIVSPQLMGFVTKEVSEDIAVLGEKFFSHCDLLLIEGFKNDQSVKIEVYRKEVGATPLYKNLKNVVAVASDISFSDITTLDINNTEEIANFIIYRLNLKIRKG